MEQIEMISKLNWLNNATKSGEVWCDKKIIKNQKELLQLQAFSRLIAFAPEMLEMLNKCYSGEIEEPYNSTEIAALTLRVEGGE